MVETITELENDSSGREKLEASIARAYLYQPLQLTLRARQDTYNGAPRLLIECIDAKPVTHGVHGRFLLKEISESLSGGCMGG